MKKFLFFIFLLGAFGASAQTMSNEEQAAAIQQLTEEVNALKAKESSWDKVIKALPKISGYVMGRYTYAGNESSFRLRRVRLTLAGNICPQIDYKVQAELSSFKLLDAYANYKPFDQLKIKAGQFKIPFTIENTDYSPTKMILVDYPMALQRLVGFSEEIGNTTLKNTGRELGVNLYGSLCKGRISYDLGIFNGVALNGVDNNKSKDVVGRLTINLMEGWRISGSYFWGEYGKEYYARERWSVGTAYDKGAWVARAEYIGGKTGFEDAEIDAEGWYVLGGYRFCGGKWAVAARYDTFTENTDLRDDTTQSNYTVGLAWKPFKNIRLQGNYIYEDQAVGHRNVAIMQLTASF